MKKGLAIAFSCMAGALLTPAANAALITIDADSHAAGTDISHAFDGISLAHLTFVPGSGLRRDGVYAAGCADVGNPNSECSALGPASFGHQADNGTISNTWVWTDFGSRYCLTLGYTYCESSPHDILEVTFDSGTDFVQFNSTFFSDMVDAFALDTAGNFIDLRKEHDVHQAPWSGARFGFETVTLTALNGGNISRLYLAGSGGWSSVDRLTYSVPEPETLALMLVGLVGAGVSARKRLKQAQA